MNKDICLHCGVASVAIECPLCKQGGFCGKDCVEEGWLLHSETECNVVQVSDVFACNLFPDGWETEGDDKVEQDLLLVQQTVDGGISQVSLRNMYQAIDAGADLRRNEKRGGLAVGGDPGNIRRYRITLQVWQGGRAPGEGMEKVNESFMGEVPEDIIFNKNEKNRRARMLAKLPFRKRRDRGITYWPDPGSVQKQNVKLPASGGFYKITLQDPDDGDRFVIAGEYFNLKSGESWYRRQLRRLKQRTAGTLKIKGISPYNVMMLSGRDPETGMSVLFTLEVNPNNNNANLLDMELYRPNSQDPVDKRIIEVNATPKLELDDVDHINAALDMLNYALSVTQAEQTEDSPDDQELVQHIDELRNLRGKLHAFASGKTQVTRVEASAALNRAMHMARVEGRLRINRWRKQLRKDASWAKEKADKWGDELESSRDKIDTLKGVYADEASSAALKAKTWTQIKVEQAKAALARSKLNDLRRAIEEVLRKEGSTLNDEAKETLNEAMAMLM